MFDFLLNPATAWVIIPVVAIVMGVWSETQKAKYKNKEASNVELDAVKAELDALRQQLNTLNKENALLTERLKNVETIVTDSDLMKMLPPVDDALELKKQVELLRESIEVLKKKE